MLDVLAGDDYADEVRTDEREARELGVNGVPFFVIDRKYAVSGAQSSERFLQTLQTVWNESQPLKRLDDSDNGNDTGVCSDGSCSIQ
ncbi:DSBA-like thioredoxin domain protein [compost metagenome]